MTQLKVSSLCVTRGDLTIPNVNFSLASGDIMGLVGKSGAGKSTLMESILGIVPHGGEVEVYRGGQKVGLQDSSGYSTQEGSLYPMLSLNENLQLFASLRGVKSSGFDERKEVLLRNLGLWEDRLRKIQDFSGGMKKRSDLAAALIHSPDVLFMDEPFAGIDPPQRDVIWDMISSIADEGRIVVLTSHMIDEMKDNCNKYGLVYDGNFVEPRVVDATISNNNYAGIKPFLEDAFAL